MHNKPNLVQEVSKDDKKKAAEVASTAEGLFMNDNLNAIDPSVLSDGAVLVEDSVLASLKHYS